LTGVLTFSCLMRQKMQDGSQDAEDMDLVIRETRRCAGIIRRLLDFARQKAPERSYSDLNALITETARFVGRSAQLKGTAVTLDLDPALPPVWIDENHVKQVVLNMLVNAQHATESGGCIGISTRRWPEPMAAEPDSEAVEMVEIAIADTGCGIPEQDLPRIFDPFFTSKEVGKGTGLGLSVSHGIVKAHGGFIRVHSEVGHGHDLPHPSSARPSRAQARGPARQRGRRMAEQGMPAVAATAAQDAQGAVADESAASYSPAGHPGQLCHPAQVPQRVLVVDDEDIVIRSTVRILEGCGPTVLTTAHDAAQALREARAGAVRSRDPGHHDARHGRHANCCNASRSRIRTPR
jgi:CheY-like chemotaxis protein